MKEVSRRSFLRFSGTAALGAAATALMGGCSSSTTTASTASTKTESTQTSGLTVGTAEAMTATDAAVASFYSHIKSATTLATINPAGEKTVGVALEYDVEIDASSLVAGGGGVGQQAAKLGLGSYFALARSITTVYANSEPALSSTGGSSSGTYVIIELGETDANARSMMFQFTRGSVGCDGPVSLDTNVIRVCQLGDVKDTSGNVIAGDATKSRFISTSGVKNADIDSFVMGTFSDDATGYYANFELKEPEGYDSSSSYPLVLFLPDAGVTTNDSSVNLRQGLGAVSWANDGKSFVLTVAGTCADIDTCLDLIDSLADQGYAIDKDRIYGTGESAGCMALIAYAAGHPTDSRFAALMLVAGQGNMTPITETPLFIVVAEDDSSSYGGMTNADTGLATSGVPYVDVQWDCTYDFDGKGNTSGLWVDYAATGQQNPSGNQSGAKAATSDKTLDSLMQELDSSAADAIADAASKDAHVIFAHIKEGTLDGTDSSIQGGNTHNFTWQYAYNIPSIRSWILDQSL